MRALSDATAEMLKPMRFGAHDRLEIDVDDDLRAFIVHATTDDANDAHRKFWPSGTARLGWIARVPERKLLDEPPNHWKLAATDYTAEIINALWPEERIIWKDERAKTLLTYLLLTTAQQDFNAELYAGYKRLKIVPPNRIEVHPIVPLAPYQQVAAHIAHKSEGYGLFMEQGTGKTATVIAKICTEAANCDHLYKAIIVCPKNVRNNWQREFERFATQPGKIEVIRGDHIDRVSSFIRAMLPEQDCKYSVCIIGYEALSRSYEALEAIIEEFGGKLDLAVLDEAHNIKSVRTDRFRYAMKLRDISLCRLVLTGTPICNSALDLFALFEFMGDGWSGFRSWKNFKAFYGVFKDVGGSDDDDSGPNEHSRQMLVGVQNLPFMKERFARLSFHITQQEALPDLPPIVYDTFEVEMTKSQQEAYDKLAEQMLLEIESELDTTDNKAMTVNNVLTKLLRLAQITCGYVTWDEVFNPANLELVRPKTIEFFRNDPKLAGLVELLKAKQPEQKTIVWSCFVPCIHRICGELTAQGIDHVQFYGQTSDAGRVDAEHRFNCDPKCQVFVGNPAAGGVGLNLLGYPPHNGHGINTNCDHVIHYASDWSYMKRAQSEKRAHRRGTRVHVRVTDLVVPETIDEEIRAKVLKKKLVAFEISDIRDILESVVRGMRV